MDPITIGALVGLAKTYADQEKEKRQRKVEAETARWSPWTKMQPNPVHGADLFGNVLQGGTTGALFGQLNPGWGSDAAAVQADGPQNFNAQGNYNAGYSKYLGRPAAAPLDWTKMG